MKVFYKTILQENSDYKYLTSEPCCGRMRKAFDEAVKFGGDGKPLLSVTHKHRIYEASFTDHYPIDFCPFCGVPVVCEESQRVRRVTRTKTVQTQQSWVEEVPG